MWYVVPAAGYDEIALWYLGINSRTAEIVRYKNGVIVERLPATRENINALNPRMPKIEINVGSPKGMKRIVETFTKKRMLYSGSSPFRQMIVDIVEDYENRKKLISMDELAERVARETGEKKRRILYLIAKMNRQAQLVIKDNNVFIGVRHPDIAVRKISPLIEYRSGVHPVKLYIYRYLSYGNKAYIDIEKELMEIGWIKRRGTLCRYLKEMVDEKCLKKIGGIEGEYGYDEWYEVLPCGKY